jgi:hypothetical protein
MVQFYLLFTELQITSGTEFILNQLINYVLSD